MNKIELNVGGRIHITTKSTLSKYPETLLGKLAIGDLEGFSKDNFYDRNPDLFSYVLDFYRTGKVVYPTIVSKEDFHDELSYWGIEIQKEKEKPPIEAIVDFTRLNLEVFNKKELYPALYNIIGKLYKAYENSGITYFFVPRGLYDPLLAVIKCPVKIEKIKPSYSYNDTYNATYKEEYFAFDIEELKEKQAIFMEINMFD